MLLEVFIALVATALGAAVAGFAVWGMCSRKVTLLQGEVQRAQTLLEAERASQQQLLEAERAGQQQMRDIFASLSSEALQQNNERFLQLAQERMERQEQATKSGLQSLIDPLKSALDQHKRTGQQFFVRSFVPPLCSLCLCGGTIPGCTEIRIHSWYSGFLLRLPAFTHPKHHTSERTCIRSITSCTPSTCIATSSNWSLSCKLSTVPRSSTTPSWASIVRSSA